MSPPAVPALELGGSHVVAAAAGPAGGGIVGGPVCADVDPGGSAAQVLDAVGGCADTLGAPAGRAWGAAVPGPFDHETGIARFHAVGKFDALDGVDVAAGIGARMSRPPASISFINDAAAFALGEWWVGAAVGAGRVLGLTLGSGVGSGFLIDGRVVTTGADLPPLGRMDLLELDGRPLEETVSRRAIRRRVTAGPPGTPGRPAPDVREIAAAARAGDPVCRTALDEAFEGLGRALKPVLASFRPDVVVVGGAIARSWDLLIDPLYRGLGADAGRRRLVVPAALPDIAGLLGAAWHAGHDSRPVPCGTLTGSRAGAARRPPTPPHRAADPGRRA